MQKGTVEDRITAAAHSSKPIPSTEINSIVVEDLRLRGWALSQSGGLTSAYDFQVALNGNGEIVRIRTLANGNLEIAYATVADSITWTTLVAGNYGDLAIPVSKAGYGVAMYVNGNNIDAFYFANDGKTIKKISSTDGGHTFGTSSTVVALGSDPAPAFPRLAAPNLNIVFYTDTADAASGTKVYFTIFSGTWSAGVSWDLSNQVMGLNGIEFPTGENYPSSFSVLSLGNNSYILIFYASQLRAGFQDGIYFMRVNNLASGLTPMWEQPKMVFATRSSKIQTVGMNQVAFFSAFPKVMQVGSEYWVIGMEVTAFANVAEYHLAYWRSLNGENWGNEGNRQYLAGTNLTYTNPSPTAFALIDLLFGQILISSNRTFLFGYDKAFRAASTQRVGISNAAKKTDLSGKLLTWDLDLPEGGEAAVGSVKLNNFGDAFTNDANIVIGARVTHKAGYYTSLPGNESVVVATGLITRAGRQVEKGKKIFEIDYRDFISLLQEDSDIHYEYSSGAQMDMRALNDYTAIRVIPPSSFSIVGSELWSGPISTNSQRPDNFAALNIPFRILDGTLKIKLRCLNTVAGNWPIGQYGGIVFQEEDDKNYWATAYNMDGDQKFSIRKAAPATTGNSQISYSGESAIVAPSAAVLLQANAHYWIEAHKWHNKIQVWWGSAVDPPQTPSASPGGAGGTLVNGTRYYYVIEGVDQITAERSIKSMEFSAVANANGTLVLVWTKSPGCNAYKIYRSTTSGSYGASSLLVTTGDVATYTDTGTALTAGAPETTTLDQRHKQNKVLDYTGIPTNLSNWGFVATGQMSPLGATASNGLGYGAQGQFGETAIFFQGGVVYRSMKIYVPISCDLAAISFVLDAQSATQPGMNVLLVKDDGTGKPTNVNTQSNILWQTIVASADLQAGSKPTGAPYTVKITNATVHLNAGTNYHLIWFPTGTLQAGQAYDLHGHNDSSPFDLWNLYTTQYSTDGATWVTDINYPRTVFLAWVTVNYESRGVIVEQIRFCSGDGLKSFEYIATDIAAKAGILTMALDSTIIDAFSAALDQGADGAGNNWATGNTGTYANAGGLLTGYHVTATSYGILRSNLSKGLISEPYIKCQMQLTANAMKAGFIFNAGTSTDPTNFTGYAVEFDNTAGAQLLSIYACNAQAIGEPTRIHQCPLNFTFPTNTSILIEIYHRAGYIYVYANGHFVTMAPDYGIVTANGYVGFLVYGNNAGGAAAKWDDFRVPDIVAVKDYHLIKEDQSFEDSLNELIGFGRYEYQARYDGALYFKRWANRTVVDSYTTTLLTAQYSKSADGVYSDIQPEGEYYARRWDATLLDLWRRRYKKFRYTNAKTDREAYNEGEQAIRLMLEKGTQQVISSYCVPTAERKDEITITNSEDGTTGNWVIASMHMSYRGGSDPNSPQQREATMMQTMNVRAFIG